MLVYKCIRNNNGKLVSYNENLPRELITEYKEGVEVFPHEKFPQFYVFSSARLAKDYIIWENDTEVWECEGEMTETVYPKYIDYLKSFFENSEFLERSITSFSPPMGTCCVKSLTLLRKCDVVPN